MKEYTVENRTKGGKIERRILIGMIVNKDVISQIAPHWEPEAFRSPWCNIVGKWAVDYFTKYGKPINTAITVQFEQWVNKRPREKHTVEMMERFLSTLSDESGKSINSGHLIDIAQEHFTGVRIDNFL